MKTTINIQPYTRVRDKLNFWKRVRAAWGFGKEQANPKMRRYGGTNTIHGTMHLDVETHNGFVVSVWFRCQQLPFFQHAVGEHRAKEMGFPVPDTPYQNLPKIHAVILEDQD